MLNNTCQKEEEQCIQKEKSSIESTLKIAHRTQILNFKIYKQ